MVVTDRFPAPPEADCLSNKSSKTGVSALYILAERTGQDTGLLSCFGELVRIDFPLYGEFE